MGISSEAPTFDLALWRSSLLDAFKIQPGTKKRFDAYKHASSAGNEIADVLHEFETGDSEEALHECFEGLLGVVTRYSRCGGLITDLIFDQLGAMHGINRLLCLYLQGMWWITPALNQASIYDASQAFALFERVINGPWGGRPAMREMVKLIATNAVNQPIARAPELARTAYDLGDLSAMMLFSQFTWRGVGMKPDIPAGRKLYMDALSAGLSQKTLSDAFKRLPWGWSSPFRMGDRDSDFEKVEKMLKMGAAAGCTGALVEYGKMCLQQYKAAEVYDTLQDAKKREAYVKAAIDSFKKAALAGDADAKLLCVYPSHANWAFTSRTTVVADFKRCLWWDEVCRVQGEKPYRIHIRLCDDEHHAVKLLREAAQGGSVIAMYEAGRLYSEGICTQRDPKMAVLYLISSAERGLHSAKSMLVSLVETEWKKRSPDTPWLWTAAAICLLRGFTHADVADDTTYDTVWRGPRTVDGKRCELWVQYLKQAYDTSVRARNLMGVCHLLGKGVEEDPREAAASFLLGGMMTVPGVTSGPLQYGRARALGFIWDQVQLLRLCYCTLPAGKEPVQLSRKKQCPVGHACFWTASGTRWPRAAVRVILAARAEMHTEVTVGTMTPVLAAAEVHDSYVRECLTELGAPTVKAPPGGNSKKSMAKVVANAVSSNTVTAAKSEVFANASGSSDQRDSSTWALGDVASGGRVSGWPAQGGGVSPSVERDGAHGPIGRSISKRQASVTPTPTCASSTPDTATAAASNGGGAPLLNTGVFGIGVHLDRDAAGLTSVSNGDGRTMYSRGLMNSTLAIDFHDDNEIFSPETLLNGGMFGFGDGGLEPAAAPTPHADEFRPSDSASPSKTHHESRSPSRAATPPPSAVAVGSRAVGATSAVAPPLKARASRQAPPTTTASTTVSSVGDPDKGDDAEAEGTHAGSDASVSGESSTADPHADAAVAPCAELHFEDVVDTIDALVAQRWGTRGADGEVGGAGVFSSSTASAAISALEGAAAAVQLPLLGGSSRKSISEAYASLEQLEGVMASIVSGKKAPKGQSWSKLRDAARTTFLKASRGVVNGWSELDLGEVLNGLSVASSELERVIAYAGDDALQVGVAAVAAGGPKGGCESGHLGFCAPCKACAKAGSLRKEFVTQSRETVLRVREWVAAQSDDGNDAHAGTSASLDRLTCALAALVAVYKEGPSAAAASLQKLGGTATGGNSAQAADGVTRSSAAAEVLAAARELQETVPDTAPEGGAAATATATDSTFIQKTIERRAAMGVVLLREMQNEISSAQRAAALIRIRAAEEDGFAAEDASELISSLATLFAAKEDADCEFDVARARASRKSRAKGAGADNDVEGKGLLAFSATSKYNYTIGHVWQMVQRHCPERLAELSSVCDDVVVQQLVTSGGLLRHGSLEYYEAASSSKTANTKGIRKAKGGSGGDVLHMAAYIRPWDGADEDGGVVPTSRPTVDVILREIGNFEEEPEEGPWSFAAHVCTLSSAQHPNVAYTRRAFVDDGVGYVEERRYAGGSLVQWREASARPEGAERRVLREVAAGLAHLHAQGIVHRTLSPHTIFLGSGSDDAKAVVCGFESDPTSIDLGALAVKMSTLVTEAAVATSAADAAYEAPLYAAPELFEVPLNEELVRSPAVDVYSLGALMVAVLCGESGRDALAARARGGAGGGAVVPDAVGLPEDTIDLMRRMLSVDPADRPSLAEVQKASFFRDPNSDGPLGVRALAVCSVCGGQEAAGVSVHGTRGGVAANGWVMECDRGHKFCAACLLHWVRGFTQGTPFANKIAPKVDRRDSGSAIECVYGSICGGHVDVDELTSVLPDYEISRLVTFVSTDRGALLNESPGGKPAGGSVKKGQAKAEAKGTEGMAGEAKTEGKKVAAAASSKGSTKERSASKSVGAAKGSGSGAAAGAGADGKSKKSETKSSLDEASVDAAISHADRAYTEYLQAEVSGLATGVQAEEKTFKSLSNNPATTVSELQLRKKEVDRLLQRVEMSHSQLLEVDLEAGLKQLPTDPAVVSIRTAFEGGVQGGVSLIAAVKKHQAELEAKISAATKTDASGGDSGKAAKVKVKAKKDAAAEAEEERKAKEKEEKAGGDLEARSTAVEDVVGGQEAVAVEKDSASDESREAEESEEGGSDSEGSGSESSAEEVGADGSKSAEEQVDVTEYVQHAVRQIIPLRCPGCDGEFSGTPDRFVAKHNCKGAQSKAYQFCALCGKGFGTGAGAPFQAKIHLQSRCRGNADNRCDTLPAAEWEAARAAFVEKEVSSYIDSEVPEAARDATRAALSKLMNTTLPGPASTFNDFDVD